VSVIERFCFEKWWRPQKSLKKISIFLGSRDLKCTICMEDSGLFLSILSHEESNKETSKSPLS
jgi:hypothetical protein